MCLSRLAVPSGSDERTAYLHSAMDDSSWLSETAVFVLILRHPTDSLADDTWINCDDVTSQTCCLDKTLGHERGQPEMYNRSLIIIL